MAQSVEAIEAKFLGKAIKAGVAGDLNGINTGDADDTGDGAYIGDPADLEEVQQYAHPRIVGGTSYRGDDAPMGEEGDEESIPSRRKDIVASREPYILNLLFEDGEVFVAEIPPLTMDRIETTSVYQTQMQEAENRKDRAARSGDPKAIARYRQESYNAKRALFLYTCPTFPKDRYPKLLSSAFLQVIAVLDEMQEEMTGGRINPNR